VGSGVTRVTVRLNVASSALIGDLVLQNIFLDPELNRANALFLRSFKRSLSRDVLCGEFRKNEDGRFCVREVKLEFWNSVCRVERRSNCPRQQEGVLAS
jgi:hypothetical protein